MAAFGSINLLRTQSALTNNEVLLLGKIRFISLIGTVIILLIGCIVGGLYVYANVRLTSLQEEAKSKEHELVLNSKKESLLVALKHHLPIVEQVIKNQYNWDGVISTVGQIVEPPALKALVVDANNTLTLNIEVRSLEETADIVNKTIGLSQDNKLKNAKIESMQVFPDGHVEGIITFVPIL
jgi:hypothetical protein